MCILRGENAKIQGWSANFGTKQGQLQAKNIIGAVAYKVFAFTLFCGIHDIHCMETFVEEFGSRLEIILYLFDFGGCWSVTLKSRG